MTVIRWFAALAFVALFAAACSETPTTLIDEEGGNDLEVGDDDTNPPDGKTDVTPTDDGTVVKNDDGQLVNDDGQLVNDDGQIVNDDGQIVNDDGQIVNDDGQIVNDDGQIVNDDGEVVISDDGQTANDDDTILPNDDDNLLPNDDDSITPSDEDGTTTTDDGPLPDNDVTCECTEGDCCDGCNLRNPGFTCRAANGECDIAETCAGDSVDCPADLFVDIDTVCGNQASGACNEPDSCDGNGLCRPNYWAENTPCSDNVYCNGTDGCNAFGSCTIHTGDPCSPGTTCTEDNGGACLTECQLAEAKASYVGCEYWGAFLQNSVTYGENVGNYAVVVANPNDTDVTVTIYGSGDTQLSQFTVAPGQINSATFDLTRLITGAGISNFGYKIVSSRPVTVTQMNPFGNVLTYSNDATLLLPKGVLGLQYHAMSWPNFYYFEDGGCDGDTEFNQPGFVSVVATEPGTTTLSVTYSAASAAGSGVAAQNAGDTIAYSLNQYQILTLNSSSANSGSTGYGADLTGSFIVADKKVAVFGGHYCTFVPATTWACDHLEHQIFPLKSWGKDFAVVRTMPRSSEADYFRILASANGTTVSWTGGVSGTTTLNAGQFHELSTTADFTVTADNPIMIAQILASQDAGAGTGDPALMLIAPNEQFRKDYIFLVAPNYDYDRLTIVAQADTAITLDGTAMNSNTFTQIPGTAYYRQYIETAEGAHTLVADKPVGLYVYGFSQYVSYAYTGGLDLVEINKCWDLNKNGTCEPASEDQSGDGICSERDC